MPTQHAKRRDIEGLRALAVTLVLLYHAQLPWFPGGFLGVDVFFVISGFLITGSLVAEAEAAGTIRLGRFYARRARRLLPAAAIVLLTTAVGVWLLLPVTTWRDVGGDIVAAAAYVVNWRLAVRTVDYLAEDVVASPVQHFWSLAIEEQFYLVWPVLLLVAVAVARRRGWPLKRVLVVVLGVGIVLPSLWWSIASTASMPARAFFDTGTRMWELAAGGLIALAPSRRLPRGPVRLALKTAAIGAVIVASMVLDGAIAWPGATALVVVVPTALLLHLGGTRDDVLERVLGLRPFQRVGAWSYSLYLWHWPPLAILAARWDGLRIREAVLIVALSTVPAVASHHLVENPVRFHRRLSERVRPSLVLAASLTLVGVLGGAALVTAVPTGEGRELVLPATPPRSADDGANDGPGWEGTGAAALPTTPSQDDLVAHVRATRAISPAPTEATDDLPRVYEDRCHVPVPVDDLRLCAYGRESGSFHVALVGDSKAGQWGDAVEDIGRQRGWRLSYWLKSGCAVTTAVPDVGGDPNESCMRWNQAVVGALADDPPDIVLVSQVAHVAHPSSGSGDPTDLLVDGMVEAYELIESAGSRVVVLLDNHAPPIRVYECVAEHLDDLPACAFERHTDWGGRRAQQAAVARGGYAVVDLADRICPTDACMPVIGDVLVYRQGSHLTRTYVDTLTDDLEERLVAVINAADA